MDDYIKIGFIEAMDESVDLFYKFGGYKLKETAAIDG
jgi:hypothetical protein